MSKYLKGFANKPCPFCGAPHGYLETSSIAFANYYERRDDEGNTYGHRVRCEACGGQTCWWHEPDDAIRAWNRREANSQHEQDRAEENHNKLIRVGEQMIEVYPTDAPETMTWGEACRELLGEGWRLPTPDELDEMYESREEIGGFAPSTYWSSSEHYRDNAWYQDFEYGTQYFGKKVYGRRVRAVRSVTTKTTTAEEERDRLRAAFAATVDLLAVMTAERDRLREELEDVHFGLRDMTGPANAHEWRKWAQGYIASFVVRLGEALQEAGNE